MAKKFDLGEYLKTPEGVSESNTEQIVLIDVDRIDPDPDNFYSLDGLEALAGNIELIGLQQPLRVRPSGERYIVVSGHRRRAAILLIRDGGSKQFAAGVPCIVEYGEASEAMRKLRLIYANSATRVMSSAEISRQAEEVSMLLYQLKEQGVEFPGRMRQHVAEACRISSSKLARLHAIRSKLDSNLLLWFDQNLLNEDAAYKLSQLPQEIQYAVGQELVNGRRKKAPSGVVVDDVLRNLDGHLNKPMKCRAHAGGPDCHHRQERIVRSIFAQYYFQTCTPGKCCMDCMRAAEGCGGACREAKDKIKLKAEQNEKANDRHRERNRLSLIEKARRFLPLVLAQEWPDDTRIPGAWIRSMTVAELKAAADGEFPPKKLFTWDHELVGATISEVKELAKYLECTTDFVLGLSDDPHGGSEEDLRAAEENPPAAAAAAPFRQEGLEEDEGEDEVYMANRWHEGNPPEDVEGWFAVKVRVCETDLIVRKCLFWFGDFEEWRLSDRPTSALLDESNEVLAWYPLPEE